MSYIGYSLRLADKTTENRIRQLLAAYTPKVSEDGPPVVKELKYERHTPRPFIPPVVVAPKGNRCSCGKFIASNRLFCSRYCAEHHQGKVVRKARVS